MSAIVFIALYGLSYGMLLFMISIGLVVTMGLMRVINIAHGAFAAAGGYLTFFLMGHFALPFIPAVLVSMVGVALLGGVLERTLFVSLYGASELDQVLLTIGLMFVCMAALNFFFGPDPLPAHLPAFLSGNIELPGNDFPVFRLFIIGVGLLVIATLFVLFDHTNIGAQLKAAVGNRTMAQATGINVRRLFSMTFMAGAALAALGGTIGFAILPLEPSYPFKYLVMVLVIVALTGFGNIKGSVGWALLVGVVDTACRYLVPDLGSYVVYLILIGILVWRDGGITLRRSAA
jgi:branched-chain amino acid transport system permease protein